MFSHVWTLGRQRTAQEAIGFYLVHFVVILLLGAAVSAVTYALSLQMPGTLGADAIIQASLWASIVYCVWLSFRILVRKGLVRQIGLVALALLSAALASVGGGLLGLIIPAYLTTRPHAK